MGDLGELAAPTDNMRARALMMAIGKAEAACKLRNDPTASLAARAKLITKHAHYHALEPRLYSLAYMIGNPTGKSAA